MEATDNWAAFGGEYLKAIDVVSDKDEYAVVGVSSKTEEGKGEVLHLELERGGYKKLFGCNKTNTYAVQAQCPSSPKDVIGRIVTFNKAKVNNPKTGELVDGLRLVFKKGNEPKEVDSDDAGIDEEGNM